MDITTLAAANAYTDKKVAEGGGASGGGGLPVVELSTPISMDFAGGSDAVTELNEADASTIETEAAKGLPLIVRFSIVGADGLPSSAIFSNVFGMFLNGSVYLFTDNYRVTIVLDDIMGKWMFTVTMPS